MERKEELEILIENQKSKLEKFWEKANKTVDGLIEQTRLFIVNFAKEHGEDVSEVLTLRMTQDSIHPALKDCSFGDIVDIRERTMFDKDGNRSKPYLECSYGSSGISQKSPMIEFTKLKLRGLLISEVGKDITGESTLMSLIKSNMSCIRNENKEGFDMENELRSLQSELQKILFDEVVDGVINAGGVKLPEPVNVRIRNNDSRRKFIDELVIEKSTTFTITIKYLYQGEEVDTYRQNTYEARRDIHAYVKLSEEIRDNKEEFDPLANL